MSDKLKDQGRGNQGGNSGNPSDNNGGGNPGGGNPGGGNPGGGNPGGGNPGGGNPGGGNPGGGNPDGGNPGGGNGGDQKITLHVLIEGGRSFTSEFVVKQKLQVVVNKTVEHFGLTDADKRELRRNDGTLLSDYSQTIEEAGLRNDETLKFLLKKAPQPEGPKKFA